MQMKEKIEKWINSKSEHIENQVLGIDGDFGTGKTTYIKNIDKILDWKEIKKKIIYINLLNLDLDNNFINILIEMFNESKDVISSMKEIGNDSINQFKNKIKSEIKSKLWLEIDAFDDIKTIQKRTLNYENSKKTFFNNRVLILDDIERINPQNILKALGLINRLSYKYEKMKILVPYNSKALNDVLSNFYGVQNIENKENYLRKYLGNSIKFEIDYVELKNFIEKDFPREIGIRNNQSLIFFIKKIKINWREIILLKEYLENNNIDWEYFIENGLIILFIKKIFENNIVIYQKSKYLVLKDEDSFNNKQSLMAFRNDLSIKLHFQKKWPLEIEKHPNIQFFEIRSCLEIDQKIYDFFKEYHNL